MFRRLLLLILLSVVAKYSDAQVVTECPVNIGFENGTFQNWDCYIGEISGTGERFPNAIRPPRVTMNFSGPVPGQHTLIGRGTGQDTYGEFSLDAPNGSDYVVQVGNDLTGRGVDRISYTINVPSNVESYSIIFSYAVVFQNPGHEADEQPKFTARVFDPMSDNTTDCGSFEFVSQGGLPGFRSSDRDPRVLYKDWAPVLVNLSSYLGRTIRLEFTAFDCSRGGHFGYAYIDFNENCSIPVTGNITCPETNKITLKALPGFFGYRWFNAETQEDLGNSDSLVLSPVPTVGTKIGIELVPYPGLGCTQTLYTVINGMEMNLRDPVPRCISVDLTDISLKVGNSSDLTYSYWRNAAATIPLPFPNRVGQSGVYYVKGMSSSGCIRILPARVSIIQVPKVTFNRTLQADYPATVDLTTAFTPAPDLSYTYWMDSEMTVQLKNPERIFKSGIYYIKTSSNGGCINITPAPVQIFVPEIAISNIFTPNGDQINDELTVLLNEEIKVRSFRIFNRWGDVVFTTPDIENYWTGFKENAMVPTGVYYWVFEGIRNSKHYVRSGYVTLLR
ncbi:MAG: gliding motility-associated C-terminal domain-containing protein [Pedobacter sp.]|jgi:gliding motility-associated-like protein